MGRPRGWTDDDLRAALEGATTMREVVARLRLVPGGASYITVRTRMEQLELDPPSPPRATRGADGTGWRRTFPMASLEEAVASATSLKQVFDRLGLQPGGDQWLSIRHLIIEQGWSTEHWRTPLGDAGLRREELLRFRASLEEADLGELAARSTSRADMIRSLGFEPRRSLYRALAAALKDEELPTEHFEASYRRMQQAPPRPRRPLAELLVPGSKVKPRTLRLRLIEEGVLEARCSSCLLTDWLGGPIPLELDHIDGDRSNNRLENLRLLCPNCHALTDTYCGRNIGRYDRAGSRDPATDE